MIIGITGTIRSGKDTVANYLVSKGFTHYSLSDYIRKVVREQGLDQTDRSILQRAANELRAKNGPGYLAEKALEGFLPKTNYAISSIRNPSEIQILRRNSGFTLISIDAPLEDRYKRALLAGDKKYQTFEEFVASEQYEKSSDPNGQQLHTCMDMADYHISNPGSESIPDLERKIDELLYKLGDKR
ncbi:MAG: AAA family ATPase [Nanoarchaeota archaeon]